ncbi:Gastric inhibitory polypeptide receptor [Acipenser ruthenus]|uniref:Gastric inhibitory polypeptide receptor n=1 Tax=Acipenser ruthenus TaxID=7906 RepID=A0A444UJB6_ACIRT|nr:Gastric inhibitory polypeptide receptor [Acipenser ruthenus]
MQISAGKMLKDTLEEWKRYHLECHKKMMYDPYPLGGADETPGLFQGHVHSRVFAVSRSSDAGARNPLVIQVSSIPQSFTLKPVCNTTDKSLRSTADTESCRVLHETRLAKSTLTLIPLLGIHKLVFALITEEQVEGTLRNVKFFLELFLSSFQGLLVAILYCFTNKEVQSEIRKKWQRRNLGASLLDEHRNTYSNMPQGGAGEPEAGDAGNGICRHGPLCQSASQQQLDTNTESHSSSDNSSSGPQHHHTGAKKGKSFCYISTRKLPPSSLDCLPPSTSGAAEGSVAGQCTESYC